jgi:tetratricopeptide (TPR) repeat protein
MINKDFILRLAEQLGRTLAILLRLRERNQHEEALIYIDDLFLKYLGLTSRLINSLSEEKLLQTLSPMGAVNIRACLWAAVLLQGEGDIYEAQENSTESYYRYRKALSLLLASLLHDPTVAEADLVINVEELLDKLEEYELPLAIKQQLFAYYEQQGNYAKAEDTLFDALEDNQHDATLITQGEAFYQRLLLKSSTDLAVGNLSLEEVHEGVAQLKKRE